MYKNAFKKHAAMMQDTCMFSMLHSCMLAAISSQSRERAASEMSCQVGSRGSLLLGRSRGDEKRASGQNDFFRVERSGDWHFRVVPEARLRAG